VILPPLVFPASIFRKGWASSFTRCLFVKKTKFKFFN
jgi:hypothetical protein